MLMRNKDPVPSPVRLKNLMSLAFPGPDLVNETEPLLAILLTQEDVFIDAVNAVLPLESTKSTVRIVDAFDEFI